MSDYLICSVWKSVKQEMIDGALINDQLSIMRFFRVFLTFQTVAALCRQTYKLL